MRKLTLGVILLMTIFNFSCEKETNDPFAEELEKFKCESVFQFDGKIFNHDYFWKFSNWNNGIGSMNGSSWLHTGDKNIQQKIFAIYDYEKRDSITNINVVSPAFSINNPYSYKKSIFDIGLKNYHSKSSTIYDGFEIQVYSINNFYSTSFGDQKSSTFEIIKTQELSSDNPENDYKSLRLWIVVSCNLYDYNGQKIGEINRGKILAEVEIERNN